MRSDGKTHSLAEQLADERALRVQAEAANRIRDAFFGALSHELRTSLNAIGDWARLQVGTLTPSEQLRAVEAIVRSFMRRLRASGERTGAFIPVLALTGRASAEGSRAPLLFGFQMHVSKPPDPPELLERLAKLWRRGVTRIP